MHTSTPSRARPAEALTVPEVCAELKVSRSTFYEWRAKKTAPPCFKLPNGGLRVRRADLDTWLASLQESAR